MSADSDYVLGHSTRELERLEFQGRFLAPLTRGLLRRAGIAPGMRVLDFGAGVGDVSLLAAELVGREGQVIALDASDAALARLRARAATRGLTNITTLAGDESRIPAIAAERRLDAIVGRLVLLHQHDPAGVLERLIDVLPPGGIVAFHEIEIEAGCWSAPDFPLLTAAFRWIIGAFTHGGMPVDIGRKIAAVFRRRGLVERCLIREAPFETGPESGAPEFLVNTVRALLPLITRLGLASAAEVDIDTLAERMHRAMTPSDEAIVPCYFIGASARVPG